MRLYECLGMDKTFSDMLKCLLYTFFLLINLNWDFVIILTALIVIDMFFGVVKSLFLDRTISVKTFLSGLCVKLMFLIIPMVVAVLGMALGWDFKFFVDLAIRALVVNESLSIISNAISIKKKEEVKNIDIVSMFLNFIRKNAVENFVKLISIPIEQEKKKKDE